MDFLSYYQLSKLHLKVKLSFINRASFMTLSYCFGEIEETIHPLPVIFLYLPETDKASTGRGW